MPEPLRIVMADDNYLVREGARRLLEDSGDVVVRIAEPVELSGEGSKAREVDRPHGDYRLSWAAQGSGSYFSVRLEGGHTQL